jgi:N-acetylglucosamine-6-phosphate deacetylase
MATFNPAKALGISHKKGEIREGMDADLAIFDEDLDIKTVIQEGNVYKDL